MDSTSEIVEIDRYTCESTGLCVRSMPTVFAFDDEGIAVADQDAAGSADPRQLQEVESMCPTTAIRLITA